MSFSRVIADVYESRVPFNTYGLPEGNSKVQLVSFETELHLWTSCSLFHALLQTSSQTSFLCSASSPTTNYTGSLNRFGQIRSREKVSLLIFLFFVAKIIGAAVEDVSLWFPMVVICSPASWYLLRFDMDAGDIKRTAETRFLAVGEIDFQCDTRNRML